jgi:tRNA-dihydrouridine synthase B
MVSANGLKYNDKATAKLLFTTEAETLRAVQLLGSVPSAFEIASKGRYTADFDIIDINMGCPVPNIIKSGEGCALIRDLPLASKIIEACKRSGKIVSVKCRPGMNHDSIVISEFAKMCEDSGASAVAVHGRTRVQMYQGRADWDIIREVQKALSIPVIANGDALTAEEAVHLLHYTGCPAAMIGRGSFGNPWIFQQAEAMLRGEKCPELPLLSSRLDTAVRQITMLAEQTSEHYACLQARHHLPWYLHGVPHSGPYRQRFAKVGSLDELQEIAHEAGNRLSRQ